MSDSRSRSPDRRYTREGSTSPPGREGGRGGGGGGEVDVLKISNDDAAFILGKNGKTKEKIARVSGAEIDLYEHSLQLEIRGEVDARRRAKKYIECVMAQRVGPVTIDEADHDADDLTTISVPSEAVGFVTGAQGNFLRSVEEEWGTLMFFADFRGKGRGREGDTEKLAIFGPKRGRRGAQLKVMAAVETKVPGYFTDKMDEDGEDEDDFGTKTLVLKPDELSYALGKKGMTRKKLARSSGCIVEYVGYTVFMSGTADERARAQEYLQWLFDQLKGPVFVEGWEERTDCTTLEVPRDCIGYVTGARRATLGKIEEEWGTLMFFMSTSMRRSDRDKDGGRRDFDGSERLAIFGDRRGRRGAELKCMSAVETKRPGYFTRDITKYTSDEKGFASDTYPMDESELSYALGKDGTTRRKLARASGAIMEYVGQIAFICGTYEERSRAKTYLKWLLKQRNGSVYVEDARDRNDVTIVPVPTHCVGYVTGNRGSSLRQVEEESGTFCFVEGGRGESEQLLIFGHDKYDRDVAERLINDLINEKLRDGDRGRDGYDRYDDYDRRDRDRYDDRYDDYDRRDRRDDYDRRDRDRDRDRRDDYDRRDRRRDDRDRYDDRDRDRDRDRRRDRHDDRDRDRDRDRRGREDDDYDRRD